MFKQSIKTNILTVFIVLVVAVSSSLMISQYYFSKQLAIESTNKDFSLISDNITNHLELVNKRIRSFLKAIKLNHNLNIPIQLEYQHPALNDMIQLISIDPNIYALYFTDKYGSFYELINTQTSTKLQQRYHSPKSTRWIILIQKDEQARIVFLDKFKNLLQERDLQKKLNPFSRTWYKKAIRSQEITTTGIYKFDSLDVNGFTFSTSLTQEHSVFAIDYTVSALNKLLKAQTFGEECQVYLFDKNATVIASSMDKMKILDEGILKNFQLRKPNKILLYKKNENSYLNIYKPLNKDLYIGISLTSYPLFEPYINSLKYSFAIALIVLLIIIPIIFFVTNKIVKPIRALIKENEKIKNRQFSDVKIIHTNIIEFIELSESFVTMSTSIKNHQQSQAKLLDSIVKLIAEAVDTKSHYTGGHCKRVPEIAQLLIHATNNTKEGLFKDFNMVTQEELKEFEIAAWLHDCGKVTTPEYVVNKASKLETIHNRIHEIRTRFEVLWRDAHIEYLEAIIDNKDKDLALQTRNAREAQLQDDFHFIAAVNVGGEFMDKEKKERIQAIATQVWQRNFDDTLGLGELELLRYTNATSTLPATENLLSDKAQHLIQREHFDFEHYKADGFKEEVPKYLYNYGEIYNLCIEKGTLTPEERYKINEHVIMSIKMLEKIPFPKHMTKVPEYAGAHHETLIGTGYPRKLKKEDLSIPSRIMAIADIFEALTASDRPYKKAKTLSETLKIMSFMVKDKHIDGDLFKLFLEEKVYLRYAKKYLQAQQIDTINIEEYL